MTFQLNVVSNTPLTSVEDIETAVRTFLFHIGYLYSDYEPKTNVTKIEYSVPYKLFVECLLKRMEKGWSVDELAETLKTSRPTIYRHLNKLKLLDILEENFTEVGEEGRKEYRIRYGNFSTAWDFTETNISATLKYYRDIVDHISKLLNDEVKPRNNVEESTKLRKESAGDAQFEIRLSNERIDTSKKVETVVADFLGLIGYLSVSENKTDINTIKKETSYRMFIDCFLRRSDKSWNADDMATLLKTTKPTIYRHLKRIEGFGILDKLLLDESMPPKKLYKLRYGDLSKAWNFTEAYVKIAAENYRKSVDHIQKLIESE
jgi:predicted transcriptional regulator